jgi:hypothetical protein
MVDFIIAPCKTRATFSAKPKERIRLNLDRIKKEFTVEIETPVALYLEDYGGIVVHNYGEIFFKTLTDEKLIRQLAEKIYGAGL